MTRGGDMRVRGGRVSMREVREQFAEMMERARHGERCVVTKHGKPRAALVSIEDYEILRRYWPDERPIQDRN